MANDLKMLKPKRYLPDLRWQLSWRQVPENELPETYVNYFDITHNGEPVGILFKGVGRIWYGIVFGKTTVYGSNVKDVGLHVAGIVIHCNN